MKTLRPRLEGSPEYAVLGTGGGTLVHRPGCPNDSLYRLTARYRVLSLVAPRETLVSHILILSNTLHRALPPT